MRELSRLTQLDPREVWAHEAHEFTPWLLANSEHLAEVLGIDLELQAAEHAVGGFWLDLFGRDLTERLRAHRREPADCHGSPTCRART
jgi:hypothetical protein